MNQFTIFVMPRGLGPYDIATTDNGDQAARVYTTNHQRDAEQTNPYDDPDWASTVTIAWAANEANANAIAGLIARKQPGKQVVIAKATAVYTAPPAEVVVQSISEKGVLPS